MHLSLSNHAWLASMRPVICATYLNLVALHHAGVFFATVLYVCHHRSTRVAVLLSHVMLEVLVSRGGKGAHTKKVQTLLSCI